MGASHVKEIDLAGSMYNSLVAAHNSEFMKYIIYILIFSAGYSGLHGVGYIDQQFRALRTSMFVLLNFSTP